MTEKIDKLCGLLNEAVKPIEVTQPSQKNDSSPVQKNTNSSTLWAFQIDQRINDLEKKLSSFQNNVLEKQKIVYSELKQRPQIESENTQVIRESAPMQTAIIRHNCVIDDITLRVSELESAIQKLDPDSIKSLIKNIVELLINRERKEIATEIHYIKGSQAKNGQLMDLLQDELKQMDERFQKDINKKVELKDLRATKDQLRRKVNGYLIISCKS